MAGRDQNRGNRKRDERTVRKAHQKVRRQKEVASSYFLDDESCSGFSNQLATVGLKLRDIPGDGNCLFRALADQLEGTSHRHLVHREQTVKYMIEHRNDFEPFVEDDCTFEDHVKKLKQDGTYAGNDAIVAFAKNNAVNIVIHQLNTPMWTISGSERSSAPQLHISYHNGDHYSSVRKLSDNSENPANIRLVVKSENKPSSFKRESKRKQASPGGNTKKMLQQIMNVTGCQDLKLIQQTLDESNFNVDYTIGLILQTMPSKSSDEDSKNSSPNTSVFRKKNSSQSNLWEEGGTGSRIFGGNHSLARDGTKKKNNVAPSSKLSNKNRKEQARKDRKKRSEERKRNSSQQLSQSDSDESGILFH